MAAIALQAAHRLPQAQQVQAALSVTPAAVLKPLDPDIVSASIPAFFIGRNKAGLWIAREVNGRVGGLFLFKSSAVDFADRESGPARCALVFPTESFELDIENRGNPLTGLVAQLRERVKRLLRRKATR